MARKWRNRRKANSPIVLPGATAPGHGSGDPAAPPPPLPPQGPREARPASTTPLADYLSHGHPGVDDGYVVLPRSLVEEMPLPWQQQMAALLARFHDAHADASWPSYRVVPSRRERLVDLDEEQLAEAGYLVEIDAEGALVYRERSGRKVADPDNTVVLVPCLDPIVRRDGGAGAPPGGSVPASGPPEDAPGGDAGGGGTGSGAGAAPAPMNIGPQPVWRTTTPPPRTADAPPLPPPPTASTVSSVPYAAPYADQYAAGPEPVPPTWSPGPGTDGTLDDGDAGSGRDWFDELPPGTAGTAPAGPSAGDPAGGPAPEPGAGTAAPGDAGAGSGIGEFGPTGDEPTEIPYRYRR